MRIFGRTAWCVVLCVGMAAAAFAQDLTAGLESLAQIRDGRAMRASSSDPNWRNGNADSRPIPVGGTLTLAKLTGPGVIHHFWNTIASREHGYSRLLVLRMYWDGEKHPSVECPIGDFFGIGHGIDKSFVSLPVKVSSDGRGRNCYWPMPFRKSALITVTNEGRKPVDAFYYYIDWEKVPRLPKNTGYFHAMYRQEFPTVSGRNYLIADIVGRGQYVGTVLSVRQLTPGWFGEGDDFFFIDGEKEPSLRGTGTEDYFCDGWGFRQQDGPFYGAPLVQGYEAGDCTSVYRWHIPDPIRFSKSLRVEIEHKGVTFNPDGTVKTGFGERSDDYSSVAFWYQTEPHKPWPPIPVGYARLYYNPRNIIEAEGLVPKATATQGPVAVQNLANASGGKQLFWRPTSKGQSLTLPFNVAKKGRYSLDILFTKSWDYGIYRVSLDGKSLGRPIDLYSRDISSLDRFVTARPIEAGTHKLAFKNVGKNNESKGYFFGLDGFVVQK